MGAQGLGWPSDFPRQAGGDTVSLTALSDGGEEEICFYY